MNGPTIALCILAPVTAYLVGKWLLTKDAALEARRKAAAQLAATLQAYGLTRIPRFLLDYATGDLPGMFDEIHQLAELFNESEDMVLKEFDTVFQNVLNVKLATTDGRAAITAALNAATAKPATA